MSFKFNQEAFKDNSFNEKIKEKLSKALNSSSGSPPTVTRTDSNECSTDKLDTDSVRLGTATVSEHISGNNGKSDVSKTTTTTTTTTTMSTKTKSSLSSKKLDILKSEIIVSKVNFPTMPELEILDLDVSAQRRSLVKGIFKISCRDAMLQIQTEIESNLLLVYSDYSPDFTTPSMICKESFTIPITMVFSEIRLEAITNIFVKNSGIGISFNDVNLDFKFDCSIKILQSTIEKRLKKSMQLLFKEVLPSVIFNMSQSLFTTEETNKSLNEVVDDKDWKQNESEVASMSKIVLEDSDLQELSPANMLRLSTLISSRQTLSLNAAVLNVPSTIPGCLERQNLHRFNSRIPSLSNYYAAYKDVEEKPAPMRRSLTSFMLNNNSHAGNQNVLPVKVLEKNAYDLKSITNIQSRIFERSTDENVRPRRRKIKIKGSKKKRRQEVVSNNVNEPQKFSNDDEICNEVSTVDSSPTIVSDKEIFEETECEKQANANNLMNEAETEHIHAPLSVRAVSGMKLPVNVNSIYFSQTEKSVLNFEPPIMSRTTSPRKLNLLEDTNYFNYKPELQRLRSSMYSPLVKTHTVLYSGKELSDQKPFLDNRRLSFVGLNHRSVNWGSDDEPPPYIN